MAEATIIDGKAVAAAVRERVREQAAELRDAFGTSAGLATVLVGEDPASQIYVRRKHEACREAGIESFEHRLAADTTADDLARLLDDLNGDPRVHGILLQLPVPPQIDGVEMTARIDPRKDVDGLHPLNAGLLAQGRAGMVPCTPAGVMELLREAGAELRGARAVVVGRSTLVGRPLAALLLAADATVTHCHSRTRDLAGVCREADVLIAAVGVPRLVNAEMVSDGTVVIDVGTNRVESGLVGDVDFDGVRAKAAALTPVPGGVGPMTIAMLLENTVKAARAQLEEVA